MKPPARSLAERQRDTKHRLDHDVDVWVSTADPASGTPYLVPLSFLWDGAALLIATPVTNPTSQNLQATGRARLALGATRDVVIIEATTETVPAALLPTVEGDAFAERSGFDPRQQRLPHNYFRLRPQLIQAWREANEIQGRDVMRDGVWIVDG